MAQSPMAGSSRWPGRLQEIVIELLKFADGTAVGRSDGAFSGRRLTDPKQLRILELRYGTIRAQALPPRESLALIERLLGET